MSTLVFTCKAQSSQAGRDLEPHYRSFPNVRGGWPFHDVHMVVFAPHDPFLHLEQFCSSVNPLLKSSLNFSTWGDCEN